MQVQRSTEEYRGQSTDKYSINQTRILLLYMRWGRFTITGGVEAPARQWGGGDRYVLLATKYCFPCLVKNPRKLKVKQLTNYPRSEDVTTAIEKNPGYVLPAIVFFCTGSTSIQSRSILSR
jgi:hypothetical protein